VGFLVAAAEAGSEGFVAPGAEDFVYPAIPGLPDSIYFTKPVMLIWFSVLIICVFFLVVGRRMQMVPGRWQFGAEGLYTFVRNGLARDIIGSKDFAPFVPFLLALFTFILVNNVFGIIPLIQFPTMSRVAFPYVLAFIVYVVFNWVGIKRHGFVGYVKMMTMPAGVPSWIYPILTPIEFASNFIFRPITLSLRLFANMFAGHLLLLVFILGGEYLLLHTPMPTALAGIPALLLAIVFTFFEALVEVLQAYIFTLLAALYIGGSLAEEH
jgi:F-type H+-transporting ATPase subunit a